MNDLVVTPEPKLTKRPTLVLLAGWGADKHTWQLLVPYLSDIDLIYLEPIDFMPVSNMSYNRCSASKSFLNDSADSSSSECLSDSLGDFLDTFLEKIAKKIPAHSVVLGWSLGGMIATQLAHKYTDKISGLITLATNANFVSSGTWPYAMPRETFTAFCENYQQHPEKTAKRFYALHTQGDINKRGVSDFLKENTTLANADNDTVHIQLLGLLDSIKNEAIISDIAQPHLALFGRGDALVPSESASVFSQRFKQHSHVLKSVKILDDCGHAPHLSQPQVVAEHIQNFICDTSHNRQDLSNKNYLKNKKKVAQAFSNAAHTYDGVAQLQRDVADQLFKIHSCYNGSIADIGCGTGYCSQKLQEHKSASIESLVSIDLSEKMLVYARRKMINIKNIENAKKIKITTDIEHIWACGDMENLPLGNQTMNGLVSSLCVQWSDNLMRVFDEAHRVLKPKGWFLLATLGPKTLYELADAWRQADPNYVHVNSFLPHADVLDYAAQSGFYMQDFVSEKRIVKYNHAIDLMRELKALGAHNVNTGSNRGLTGRKTLRALTKSYEPFRGKDGLLPATYDVIYLLLEKR